MALMDHLKELKNRLIKSAIGLVIGGIGGWILYDPVLSALKEPVDRIAETTGGTSSVNFSSIASPFDFKLQLSLLIGAVISSCGRARAPPRRRFRRFRRATRSRQAAEA